MFVKYTSLLLLSFAAFAGTTRADAPAPTAGELNALKTSEETKDKNEKPKKVSELLKKANDTMNRAQDAYIDGDVKKAIELYRRALQEMVEVELKNPERAAGAEFAPLRFRKALCETEIDRIMLEEVTANARSIAVTDTSELEKKRNERQQAAKKRNMPDPAHKLSASKSAQTAADKKESEKGKKQETESILAKKTVESEKIKNRTRPPLKPEEIGAELETAKDLHSIGKFDQAVESLISILKISPEHKEARFLLAMIHVQSGSGEDAVIIIEDLVTDFPRDTPVLLLAAAAYVAAGQPMVALDRLDEAVRCEPSRPDAYRNIAWLLAKLTPDKTENAEAYYRQSVKLGAARDAELEKLLGF